MTTKATITAALAALLLTASCSGKPEVLEPGPTRGASAASPTDSTGGSPPTVPASAREDSPSGAANYARHWLKVSDYASWTGDTVELTRLSKKSCGGCTEYIDYYREIYEGGGHLRGGKQEMTTASTASLPDDSTVILVRSKVSVAAGEVKTDRTSEATKTPSETNRLIFRIERSRGVWTMAEVGLDR
jgi:hypothetical protein